MNHYAVLGVPMDADDQAIRSAYRSLVRRYHPDAGSGSSPEKFRELVEAYETLGDPIQRAAYDRSLRRPAPSRIPVEPLIPTRAPAPLRMQHFYPPAMPIEFWFDEIWRALEEDLRRRW